MLLALASVVFFSALDWLLKGNVLRKNLRKLDEPEKESAWTRFWIQAILVVLSAALSWIQVILSIGSILWKLMQILREVFVTVPEEIKQLRFPLYNNPNMSREAVWAYARALEARAGANLPTESALLGSLQAVIENYKDFDALAALRQLKALTTVSSDVIDAAMVRGGARQSAE